MRYHHIAEQSKLQKLTVLIADNDLKQLNSLIIGGSIK